MKFSKVKKRYKKERVELSKEQISESSNEYEYEYEKIFFICMKQNKLSKVKLVSKFSRLESTKVK